VNGYVVIPGLLPTEKVDGLLQVYKEQIVPSKAKFYRQSTNAYDTNRFTTGDPEFSGYSQLRAIPRVQFDANAASAPHQDSWYVDTVPYGKLLGAWIALEDIEEDAGAHADNVSAAGMKKGDVLFSNSGTIHGALPTKNLKYSRRSLTGDYIPSELAFGNLFITKPWVRYENYEGHEYYANQPEHSLKAELMSKVKVALYDNPRLLKFVRKFQKRSIAEV
jgi:phytanoyl-CoA hydroxylase